MEGTMTYRRILIVYFVAISLRQAVAQEGFRSPANYAEPLFEGTFRTGKLRTATVSQSNAYDEFSPPQYQSPQLQSPQLQSIQPQQQAYCPPAVCPPEVSLPWWTHCSGISADWLFLTARQQDLDYATPVDGTTNTAVPVGQTAMLSPGYRSGYRIGGTLAIDDCSSFVFAWTSFQSNASDSVVLPGGDPLPNAFLRSEVVHPNTVNVASDSLSASGNYGIDFESVDAAYSKTLVGNCDYRLNGSAGFRYGGLNQDLTVNQQIQGAVDVTGDIDFAGYGPRFGLDFERCNCHGLLFYNRGALSLLAGRFDSQYRQSSIFAGPQAIAGIEEDRIVPQLDLEFGTGYLSENGCFRATVGYMFGYWGNVVTMPEFVDAVQADAPRGVSESLVFDGIAVRAEVRF